MSTHLLRDLALFVEVVNTRNFARAAVNLEIPPSTLSRRIAELEKSIGLRLLNRTTRRVDVTEAGAAYHARIAHLVEEASVAHEQLTEEVAVPKGTLRLACTADFATIYMPDLLIEFTQQHPNVNVELDLNTRAADLIAEHLDAAIRIGALPDSQLVARRVGQVRQGLFAAPEYLRIAGSPSGPRDLSAHMCVRLQSGLRGSHWILRNEGSSGPQESVKVSVDGRFVAGSMSMLREITIRGAGIGLIDQVIAQVDVERGSLVRVLPDWTPSHAPVHLLTPSRLMPARVRMFGDLIVARFNGR